MDTDFIISSQFRTRLVMSTVDSVVIDRIALKCSFNWFSKCIISNIDCDSLETRLFKDNEEYRVSDVEVNMVSFQTT